MDKVNIFIRLYYYGYGSGIMIQNILSFSI